MQSVSGLHIIRKHILKTLAYTRWARFKDMKPPKTDSNLYSYHLKALIKEGFVENDKEKGYQLTPLGLRYVDHVSLERFEPRWQPKITTSLFIENENGEVIMWRRQKQPFISSWSLPHGKVHYEDESLEAAARREIAYFTDKPPRSLRYAGLAEVVTTIRGELVAHVITHIFSVRLDGDFLSERLQWINPDEATDERFAPGAKEIVNACQLNDQLFYRYFDVEW